MVTGVAPSDAPNICESIYSPTAGSYRHQYTYYIDVQLSEKRDYFNEGKNYRSDLPGWTAHSHSPRFLWTNYSSFFYLDRLPDLARHRNRNPCFVKTTSKTHRVDVYTVKLSAKYGNEFRS